jgi:DNA anti-recombination protein RmuC
MERPMASQTLVSRLDKLEERVTLLEQLPARVDALALQISQLRDEMRAEFSAARSRDEETSQRVSALHQETNRRFDETNRRISVLHEDIIGRLALIQEGQPRPRQRR